MTRCSTAWTPVHRQRPSGIPALLSGQLRARGVWHLSVCLDLQVGRRTFRLEPALHHRPVGHGGAEPDRRSGATPYAASSRAGRRWATCRLLLVHLYDAAGPGAGFVDHPGDRHDLFPELRTSQPQVAGFRSGRVLGGLAVHTYLASRGLFGLLALLLGYELLGWLLHRLRNKEPRGSCARLQFPAFS